MNREVPNGTFVWLPRDSFLLHFKHFTCSCSSTFIANKYCECAYNDIKIILLNTIRLTFPLTVPAIINILGVFKIHTERETKRRGKLDYLLLFQKFCHLVCKRERNLDILVCVCVGKIYINSAFGKYFVFLWKKN